MFQIEIFDDGRRVCRDEKQTASAARQLVVMHLNALGKSANIKNNGRLVIHLWYDGDIQTLNPRKRK